MDKFSKRKRSEIMSRIHGTNTEFEKSVFREIKKAGINFEKNYHGIIGKPDIALLKVKKAIFLHSDFWHGWQLPRWEKILPNDFWVNKLRRNRNRDKLVLRKLRQNGWQVLIVWEHQLKHDFRSGIKRIIKFAR